MAATTTYSATMTLAYDDDTTRNVTFDDVDENIIGVFKGRITSLNSAIADTVTGAAYKETFISDSGSPIKKISGGKYTATTEEVIYNG